jgi:hypothetical protein
MTTIFWHKDRVYADSRIIKGGEAFDSLTKINALDKPFTMASKKHPKFNDVILGWTSSGAIKAASAFIRHMLAGSMTNRFDLTLLIYEAVEFLDLINDHNHFEVILIGVQANYSFNFVGQQFFSKVYDHAETWAMGTGAELILSQLTEKVDPVRAMYITLYRDECSGGLIDVWQLSKGRGKPKFQRIGIGEILSDDIVTKRVLAKPHDPWPLTFTR